jgi:hypothetical protein
MKEYAILLFKNQPSPKFPEHYLKLMAVMMLKNSRNQICTMTW